MITNATEEDNGNYVCGVKNVNGIATSSAFVSVIDKDGNADSYIHTWVTIPCVVVFVVLVIIIFILVKMYKRREENKSKCLVQISPTESVDEIQHGFRNKTKNMQNFVGIDVEKETGGFNNFIAHQDGSRLVNDGAIRRQHISGESSSSEGCILSTSTNLFDCKCVEPGPNTSRPNSPCF